MLSPWTDELVADACGLKAFVEDFVGDVGGVDVELLFKVGGGDVAEVFVGVAAQVVVEMKVGVEFLVAVDEGEYFLVVAFALLYEFDELVVGEVGVAVGEYLVAGGEGCGVGVAEGVFVDFAEVVDGVFLLGGCDFGLACHGGYDVEVVDVFGAGFAREIDVEAVGLANV